jgi:hypothetical protein
MYGTIDLPSSVMVGLVCSSAGGQRNRLSFERSHNDLFAMRDSDLATRGKRFLLFLSNRKAPAFLASSVAQT